MNVETLQDNLTRVRENLLDAIDDLPDEALLEPGIVFDNWRIADILGVIAAWESEVVTGLAEIQRRKKPTKLLRAIDSYDQLISSWQLEFEDRSLDAVFDDLQGARIQLEVRLEDLTDRDLNNPREFRWLKGKPLWPFLARNTYEREAKWLPPLIAFAQRYAAEHDLETELYDDESDDGFDHDEL
ncbi:MAG: ClbS/DfsB family four-helix bundle protein [Anaerolineae bacterium]|nr:ClbS/DfsB family four-helix bundle protein [Anaerolineae bacterium]MCO5192644.1 ClbS/DfsB family four-helix bundle protein [Anaerolineae bacterium]MCO5205340.1 ClbS/DfsB family four-helix bundle protein [Anaerolineae bacterium]